MSVLLALLTACVLIAWGVLHKSKKRVVASPVFVERFVHPGHTWMRLTEDGDALVGIDDFAQSLIGSIDGVELPRLLKRVEQGNVAWYVRHNHRIVPLVSPLSGRVIEKNEMVLHNPSLVNSSPYGDGWLLRIKPRRIKTQLHNLLTGKHAQQWLEHARQQLIRIFSATPALMYQDGGVIVKDLSDRISEEEWRMLEIEFLRCGEPAPPSSGNGSIPSW